MKSWLNDLKALRFDLKIIFPFLFLGRFWLLDIYLLLMIGQKKITSILYFSQIEYYKLNESLLNIQSWNLSDSKDIKGLYHSVEEWHLVVNFTFTARDQENIEMHIIKITFSPSEPPSRDWVTRSAQNTDTYTKSQQPCSLHFFTHYQFSHYSLQF